MNSRIDEIKEASSELSAAERAELVEFLLSSLDDGEAEWIASWRGELDRRLEELRSGTVQGVHWQDVLQRLREQVG